METAEDAKYEIIKNYNNYCTQHGLDYHKIILLLDQNSYALPQIMFMCKLITTISNYIITHSSLL